jgi:hypothetical protein
MFFGARGSCGGGAESFHERSRSDIRRRATAVPDEPQIGLVDERGGLQRVTRSFAAQVATRDTVQLVVDERTS